MNPKRRFFQIHLSTAVVLMLVAGVLVWANVRMKAFHREFKKNPPWDPTYSVITKGWPFTSKWNQIFYYRERTAASPIFSYRERATEKWSKEHVIYNALIALAILLAVWQLCEWRIRRRAAKIVNPQIVNRKS